MARTFLITGAGGMLGTALRRVLAESGVTFTALSRQELDITDPAAVARRVERFAAGEAAGASGARDAVLVNAAAYTDVEAAEDDPDTAYAVNERGARLLAEAAAAADLGFVHVSTDFVFDGAKDGPYIETDTPNPLSVYGASKLAGELAVAKAHPRALIARTAWVYGPGGANFPAKILKRARAGGDLAVVTGEIGSPTYAPDLACGILGLVDVGASGLYHLAGSGRCSRYEFAEATLKAAGLDKKIRPAGASEFATRVRRPRNSVLDCGAAAALGVRMRAWRLALVEFVAEEHAGTPFASHDIGRERR